MPESRIERRNSRALEAPLIADPKARAAAEARNGFRQYDAGIKTVQAALERGAFKLRLSLILTLHREALAGISSYAGNFRPAGVKIEGSKHEPASARTLCRSSSRRCATTSTSIGTRARRFTSPPISCGGSIGFIHLPTAMAGHRAFFHTSCCRSALVHVRRARRQFRIKSSDNRTPYFDGWIGRLPIPHGRAAKSMYRKWKNCWASYWLASWPASMRLRAARCQHNHTDPFPRPRRRRIRSA